MVNVIYRFEIDTTDGIINAKSKAMDYILSNIKFL